MPMGEPIWIPRQAYGLMCALGEKSFPLETGGVFLGYKANNGELVVTALIGPGPNARHSRYRFVPDAEYQQEKIEVHHARSEGRETYLGDWHTHPRGSADLSSLDKRTLIRIADTPSSGTDTPVMAVLGGESEKWDLNAVRFDGWIRRVPFKRCNLVPLLPRLYDRA